jgi:hypothetical protein
VIFCAKKIYRNPERKRFTVLNWDADNYQWIVYILTPFPLLCFLFSFFFETLPHLIKTYFNLSLICHRHYWNPFHLLFLFLNRKFKTFLISLDCTSTSFIKRGFNLGFFLAGTCLKPKNILKWDKSFSWSNWSLLPPIKKNHSGWIGEHVSFGAKI